MQPLLKRNREISSDDEDMTSKWQRLDLGEPYPVFPIINLKKRKRSLYENIQQLPQKRIHLEDLTKAVQALNFEDRKNHFEKLPNYLVIKILSSCNFASYEESDQFYQNIEKVCHQWQRCFLKVRSGRYNEIESNEAEHLDNLKLNNALAYAKSMGHNLKVANLGRYKYITDEQFRDFATTCPNITTLALQDALISDIAFEIMANLPKLEILEIRWCDIIICPDALAKLFKLKKLVFSSCFFLKKLPNLENLHNLQTLEIAWCNQLSSLPKLPYYSLFSVKLNYCSSLENMNQVQLDPRFTVKCCPKFK